ncbi:MAG: ROK family protein [Bacteroidota bacterium]|nr:ROK family protein [Bacteroidota bacterium]
MNETDQKILSIDIGGSNIKGTVLNLQGDFLQEYQKLPTPDPSTPGKVMEVIRQLAGNFPEFDKISVGFPGFIKKGIVKTAPNLGTFEWADFNLKKNVEDLLGKPALVINDADFQALSIAGGNGIEMVITLGTGFGSAILNEGVLIPHLEIAHHPVTKSKDYDEYIGEAELIRIGKKKWNKRMKRVIEILKVVVNYDTLYISGGNADKLDFKLDENIIIIGNRDGIKGGAALWKQTATAEINAAKLAPVNSEIVK